MLQFDVASASARNHEEVNLVRIALSEEVCADNGRLAPCLQSGGEVIKKENLRLDFKWRTAEDVDRCFHTLPQEAAL